jgi:iron complex outermembrane recepter protein
MKMRARLLPWFSFLLFVSSVFTTGFPNARAQRPLDSLALSGHVQDSTGSAIAGAHVALVDAAGNVAATAVTNGEGHFSLSGILPGKYLLQVSSENFDTASQGVVVSSASTGVAPVLITLRVASVQQTVIVAASGSYTLPVAAGATKTDMPIMETPISVQVIPLQVLQDQQAVRIDAALQNVSGVIPNNDSYGTNDSFSIRGFDAQEMTYEDGLRLDQYSNAGFPIDMANTEKIEVVKGPASVLYGQAEPGGVVNVVTKKPLDTRFYSLQQQFGSYSFYRTNFDATGPFLGKKFFYRLPVDYENSGSFRDFVFTDWFAMFPSLQWRPTDQTQITATFHYATGTMVLDNGIPFLTNGTPAKIPISRNLAEPDTNRTPDTEYYGKVVASHDFKKDWQIRLAYKSEYIDNPVPNSVSYAGDADAVGELQRYGFTEEYFNHMTSQVVADLMGRFSALGMKHSVLAGFDYYYQDGHYNANSYDPGSINIYHPVYGQPFIPPDPANNFYVHNGQNAYGAYVQDQVTLPKNLFLLVGVRFNRVNTFNNGYGQATSVTDHPSPTPRVGLLWQPRPQMSLYGSYSSNYGATPLGSLTPDGKTLPPQSAQQFEIGVKTELLQKRLVAATSIYQITKQNIPSADPTNPTYTVAIGEARSRGFEIDVSGQISSSWKVIGGYSYINALVTKDTNSPSLAGLHFPDAPYDSGSVWAVYEAQSGSLKRLKLGGGLVGRTGQVAYESPDGVTYMTDRIPGFAITSLMASYNWQWEKLKISAQVNINNLFDQTYFSSVNPSQAAPGSPFNIMPALRVEF